VDITELVELLGFASGIVGLLGGSLWAGLRFGRRLSRILPVVDKLHHRFGETPVDELHRIVRGVQSSVGELEVRQRIAERHLEIGVYVCGADGKCNWCNDYLCEAFGLDSKEMAGHGWLSAIESRDRIRVHAAWQSSVESELPYEERYRVTPKDDTDSWDAITEAWPVKVDNKILCYVGYVRRIEQ
jgi:PAS domain-containing protein